MVGWSLGGHVALDFAALYPEKVVGIMMGKEGFEGFRLDSTAGSLTSKKEQFTEDESILYHTASGFSKDDKFIIEAGIRADGVSRPTMVGAVASGIGINEREFVEKKDIPLVIAIGLDDPYINNDYIKALQFKNLHAIQCFKCSHSPFWEKSKEFNGMMESALVNLWK